MILSKALRFFLDFFFYSVLVPVNVKNIEEEKDHHAHDRRVNTRRTFPGEDQDMDSYEEAILFGIP